MENKKVMNRIQDLGAVIALILLVAVISIISPEFRTVKNFLSLLRQSSINGLIAFGMTCVILTAESTYQWVRCWRLQQQFVLV